VLKAFDRRVLHLCERCCGRAPALARSRRFAAFRRSRRDFKERAFPMAEERWSVAEADGFVRRQH
jgi:hypothetical protein